MSNSIFYSWQSDLPNSTNRGFIRGCLDRAIKAINQDLGVDDALRAEDGVKGVPGTPDVANRIFERVDNCAVFVADISIIGDASSGRPVPNPNVMIEYGRATSSIGDGRILIVFNEKFGDWEKDRPFDLRHKLRPICYSLAEDHSKDEKRDARAALTKLLEGAIREIIEAERPEEAGADVEFDAEAAALSEAWVGENWEQATKGLDELDISMRWEFRSSVPSGSIVTTQKELFEIAGRSTIGTSGWPIGLFLGNPENRPTPRQNGIAAAVTGNDRLTFDYWAWSLTGQFYMMKSIHEDSSDKSAIFFNTRIWRTTEALMYIINMYAALGLSPKAAIRIQNIYSGFINRTMKSTKTRMMFRNYHVAKEDRARSEIQVTLEDLRKDLMQPVKAILEPFFVLFDFFDVPDETYAEIVDNFINGKCS